MARRAADVADLRADAAEARVQVLKSELAAEDQYRDARRAEVARLLEAEDRGRPVVLAILELEDRGGTLEPGARENLTQYLALAIVSRTGHRVVPRASVRALLIDVESRGRSCHDERCHIELGKVLAADRLLLPSVLTGPEGCVLGLKAYDLETETAVWASSRRSSCALPHLMVGWDQLAAQLAAEGKGEI